MAAKKKLPPWLMKKAAVKTVKKGGKSAMDSIADKKPAKKKK